MALTQVVPYPSLDALDLEPESLQNSAGLVSVEVEYIQTRRLRERLLDRKIDAFHIYLVGLYRTWLFPFEFLDDLVVAHPKLPPAYCEPKL